MHNKYHELPFQINIDEFNVQALYEGKVYFEMETHNPSRSLLLLQTRIFDYHPLRQPDFKGVYYLDATSHTIKSCQRESDVPSGCRLMHNWLIDVHLKEDKERGIKALNN
jgi:hypothetical protein